jgi:hypothetical protein
MLLLECVNFCGGCVHNLPVWWHTHHLLLPTCMYWESVYSSSFSICVYAIVCMPL